MSCDVEICVKDCIQTIRLTRSAKKNALTQPMYRAISDALQSGDTSDDVAAHVFVGSNGIFTAGNDIADFLATSQGTGSLGPEVLRFIMLLPVVQKPMIAAVDGPAIGIGTTLLFHCDLVYASPASVFQTPFLDLGVVPEAASSLLAPLRLGYARAFELLALGDAFTAERALSAGLVNAIVAAGDVETTALAAAARLAAKPPEALALARRLMRGSPEDTLKRTAEEADAFAARLKSPEAREAFQAFLGKRKPDFAKARSKA